MFRLFKKPKAKPIFNKGQRIRLKKDNKAYYSEFLPLGVCYYQVDQECTIRKDMALIYYQEDKHKIYFRVRSNFYASDINARDQSIVYFKKKDFKTIEYRKE